MTKIRVNILEGCSTHQSETLFKYSITIICWTISRFDLFRRYHSYGAYWNSSLLQTSSKPFLTFQHCIPMQTDTQYYIVKTV